MDINVFEKHNKGDYTNPLPGIRQKTLVFGDRTLMTEFLLTKDRVLPNHSHPYEQTGYLVKGRIILKIGETEYDTMVGDSWCIPSNVNHGAKIIEDSVAIEIFSPVREDYLLKETPITAPVTTKDENGGERE
jgi:quercetin dioxygenase-like cupin family protein